MRVCENVCGEGPRRLIHFLLVEIIPLVTMSAGGNMFFSEDIQSVAPTGSTAQQQHHMTPLAPTGRVALQY